jgi:hypothetical protein
MAFEGFRKVNEIYHNTSVHAHLWLSKQLFSKQYLQHVNSVECNYALRSTTSTCTVLPIYFVVLIFCNVSIEMRTWKLPPSYGFFAFIRDKNAFSIYINSNLKNVRFSTNLPALKRMGLIVIQWEESCVKKRFVGWDYCQGQQLLNEKYPSVQR